MMDLLGTCNNLLTAPALPLSLFVAGLTGGFLHCPLMCGGLIISNHTPTKSCGSCQNTIALGQLQLGRIFSYALLTFLTYQFFSIGFAWSPLRQIISAIILSLAGVIFLTLSFPLLQTIWPWAAEITIPLPFSIKSSLYKQIARSDNNFTRGFLMGLMPCGLLFAAVLASAASPDLLTAMLCIIAFFLGTVPSHFMIKASVQIGQIFKPDVTKKIQRSVYALNGIFMIFMAGFISFQLFHI